MEEKIKIILGISGVFSLFILVFTFLFLRDVSELFTTMLVLAGIVLFAPIGLIKYSQGQRTKQLEDNFPQFMNDLVETVRSGMTLPQAIKGVSENDYGALSPYIKKLNVQLEWGIPFSKAFTSFTNATKSKLIARIGSTIIESHEFGGNLTDVFESISKTTVEIERLREERKLYLNSQMISGYIIFFIFLVVLIGLQKFLVPTLSEISLQQVGGQATVPEIGAKKLASEYKSIFRNLIILQAIFAGLVVGKMSEGAIAAGIKHGFILVIGGVVIFTLATL